MRGPTRRHRVPAAEFAALAAGSGDRAALLLLRAAQLSRRIVMVRALIDSAASHPDVDPRLPACLADGFGLLAAAARRSRPDVDDVLAYPMVGAWAVHCLRRLRGVAPGSVPLEEDLGYFGGVAVVAAVRAGEPVDLTVRTRAGRLFLPTFGHLHLPTMRWVRVQASAGSSRLAVLSSGEAGDGDLDGGAVTAHSAVGDVADLEVDLSGPATRQWVPRRRLRSIASGCAVDVAVEDADPYRGCGALRVRGPLDDGEVARWQALLDAAWSMLVDGHRQQAEALSACLRALVPLGGTGQASSATSGDAFGAVALVSPGRATTLAASLVHELAHAKLYALLDMVELLDDAPSEVAYAPWRPDPRPLDGLLQGAYAFLTLVEFWSTRQAAAGDAGGRREAAFEVARWRDGVALALDTLTSSGRLTAAGRRFVAGMAAGLARLRDEPVDEAVAARARDVAAAHQAAWRMRHARTDPGEVDRWARAWHAQEWCPPPASAVRVAVGPASADLSPVMSAPAPSDPAGESLEYLAGTWLADPTGFASVAVGHPGSASATAGASGTSDPVGSRGADTALLAGDYAGAAELYKGRIAVNPDDVAAWAGLAVARRHALTEATPAFVSCPEVVRALRTRLLRPDGTGPDPDEVAAWVGRRVRANPAATSERVPEDLCGRD